MGKEAVRFVRAWGGLNVHCCDQTPQSPAASFGSDQHPMQTEGPQTSDEPGVFVRPIADQAQGVEIMRGGRRDGSNAFLSQPGHEFLAQGFDQGIGFHIGQHPFVRCDGSWAIAVDNFRRKGQKIDDHRSGLRKDLEGRSHTEAFGNQYRAGSLRIRT